MFCFKNQYFLPVRLSVNEEFNFKLEKANKSKINTWIDMS